MQSRYQMAWTFSWFIQYYTNVFPEAFNYNYYVTPHYKNPMSQKQERCRTLSGNFDDKIINQWDLMSIPAAYKNQLMRFSRFNTKNTLKLVAKTFYDQFFHGHHGSLTETSHKSSARMALTVNEIVGSRHQIINIVCVKCATMQERERCTYWEQEQALA